MRLVHSSSAPDVRSFINGVAFFCPQGFLVNRVLIPMINEAFFCLMEV